MFYCVYKCMLYIRKVIDFMFLLYYYCYFFLERIVFIFDWIVNRNFVINEVFLDWICYI